MKRRVIRFITGAFLVTMVFADSALAAIRTWPGTAPCAGSFVDCLASAQAGDTVRIVSTATIPDQIALTLPVSIETAPGASATFTSTTAHTFTLPGSAPWTATLRGLKFVGGTLRFTLNGAQAGELRLEQLSISGNASGQQMQINFNLAQANQRQANDAANDAQPTRDAARSTSRCALASAATTQNRQSPSFAANADALASTFVFLEQPQLLQVVQREETLVAKRLQQLASIVIVLHRHQRVKETQRSGFFSHSRTALAFNPPFVSE